MVLKISSSSRRSLFDPRSSTSRPTSRYIQPATVIEEVFGSFLGVLTSRCPLEDGMTDIQDTNE